MPANPRSRRLVDPAAIVAAGSLLYTAPAGRIVLVKSARFVNVTGDVQTVRYTIGALAPEHALLWDTPIAAGSVVSDEVWGVLNPGDELWASASEDAAITVTISGAELGGV